MPPDVWLPSPTLNSPSLTGTAALILAYKVLHEALVFYLTIPIIDLDERAAAIVGSLR